MASEQHADSQRVHCAWLVKEKGDTSRTKWLQSSLRRYFTIDFEKQIVFYAHSSSPAAAVSNLIGFNEILGASLVRPEESAAAKGAGLRRSFSGTLAPQARRGESAGAASAFGGASTGGAGNVFILHTNERKIRLTADQESEAQLWVDLLNRAQALAASSTTCAQGQRAIEAAVPRRQREGARERPSVMNTPQATLKPPAIDTPSANSQVSTASGSTSTSSPAWSEVGETSSEVRVELEEGDFEPTTAPAKRSQEVVPIKVDEDPLASLEAALQRNGQDSAAQLSPQTLSPANCAVNAEGLKRWSRRFLKASAICGEVAGSEPEEGQLAVAEGPKQLQAADFGFEEDLPSEEDEDAEAQADEADLEAELQKRKAELQRVFEGGAPASPSTEPDVATAAAAAAAAKAEKEERRRARKAAKALKIKREQDEAWARSAAADLAAGDEQLAARMQADLLLARGCGPKATITARVTQSHADPMDSFGAAGGEGQEQGRGESAEEAGEEQRRRGHGRKHSHAREEERVARTSSKVRSHERVAPPGDTDSRIAADLLLAQRHQQRLVASI
jgi:hypothetical protein